MNDLTSYFIDKVEQKEKKENYDNNNDKGYNDEDNKNNKCKNHVDRKVEYYCCNCNEYLCSECLVIFNKKSVDKHSKHIILPIEKIDEFNLNDIIKIYPQISSNKEKIEKLITDYKKSIREIEIRKKRTKEITDIISNDLQANYSSKINGINSLLKYLKNKKNEIDKGAKEFQANFQKFKESSNNNEKAKILSDLEKLNHLDFDENSIEKTTKFKKDLCCESYVSELIELHINNGQYKEEETLIEKVLTFIPNVKSKLTAQLLLNNIVFNLSFPISNESNQNDNPKYFGDFVIISKNACEYAIFSEFLFKTSKMFSVEFPFSKMKPLLDDNNKCQIKIYITKNYYK